MSCWFRSAASDYWQADDISVCTALVDLAEALRFPLPVPSMSMSDRSALETDRRPANPPDSVKEWSTFGAELTDHVSGIGTTKRRFQRHIYPVDRVCPTQHSSTVAAIVSHCAPQHVSESHHWHSLCL